MRRMNIWWGVRLVVMTLGVLGSQACSKLHAQGTEVATRAEEEKSAKTPALVPLHLRLLRLRIVEDTFVYTGSVFVPNPGEKLTKVTETKPQTYTVHVPYTEMVNGKPVTRTRAETRTRLVSSVRVTGGKYESKELRLGSDAIFLDLDGKEVDRKELLSRTYTAELLVPLIQGDKRIPDLWQSLLKPDTVVLWTEAPLELKQ